MLVLSVQPGCVTIVGQATNNGGREWKFSSFQALCSDKPTKLERDYVLAIFGNKQAFLNYHAKPIDRKYKWHD